jgi:hypothetical protein
LYKNFPYFSPLLSIKLLTSLKEKVLNISSPMMIGVLSYFCFLLNSINLRNSSLFARLAETYFSLMKKGVAGILSSESMCSNPLSFNPSLLDESISAEKAFGNLNYLCHKFKSDELDISNSSCFVMKMSSEAKDLTVLVVICELVLR